MGRRRNPPVTRNEPRPVRYHAAHRSVADRGAIHRGLSGPARLVVDVPGAAVGLIARIPRSYRGTCTRGPGYSTPPMSFLIPGLTTRATRPAPPTIKATVRNRSA